MLIAPAAPAATAMQSTAATANTGFRWPGATIIPTMPVNTTSVTTRGFSRLSQSRQVAAARASEGPATS